MLPSESGAYKKQNHIACPLREDHGILKRNWDENSEWKIQFCQTVLSNEINSSRGSLDLLDSVIGYLHEGYDSDKEDIMNMEIEAVCSNKPKFMVGDVVTIPEASPDKTYVIKESIDFGPSAGIVYEIFAPENTGRLIQYSESGLELQYHDVSWEYKLLTEAAINNQYTWGSYIPENVTDENKFFMEMAEIYPKYNSDHNIKDNKFKVCVFEGNEGPIPHVHIFFEHKTGENHGNNKTVSYVCLGTAEYAPQHKKETKILNSHERKALSKFFDTEIPNRFAKDKNGNLYAVTCWQECVQHWMDENPGSEKYFEINEETGLYTMPDYSKLNN